MESKYDRLLALMDDKPPPAAAADAEYGSGYRGLEGRKVVISDDQSSSPYPSDHTPRRSNQPLITADFSGTRDHYAAYARQAGRSAAPETSTNDSFSGNADLPSSSPQQPFALPREKPLPLRRSHQSTIVKQEEQPDPPYDAFAQDGVMEALEERDALEAQQGDKPVVTPTVGLQRPNIETAENAQQGSPDGLVPVTALADERFMSAFRFKAFNRVQSKVFRDVYQTDENLVVSAPTSSGKTTVFELGFMRMVKTNQEMMPLALYIAPLKALCSERARDWKMRLNEFSTVVELTGDTSNVHQATKLIEDANLVVITPEKLDSITRRISPNVDSMLRRLKLVMIDEVHILGDSRGATLEVVVSRLRTRKMKLNRLRDQDDIWNHKDMLRFIAVSATVPNIKDVARWIGPVVAPKVEETQAIEGVEAMPTAKLHVYGDEYRPVPLEKIVVGVDATEWTLDKKLDQELMPYLSKHSKGRPMLIFCPTRKSCQSTAEVLLKQYMQLRESRMPLPWQVSNEKILFADAQLSEWAKAGVAVHHAGIDNADRRAIEDFYRAGKLPVIICTSTLAVGVNLPAHLVIIKGTQVWAGLSGFREYSDIDILQMMGRAGRPQYDKSGTVVLMCERFKVPKYREMLHSQSRLESRLHERLTEHINSEIGLGTIDSLEGVKDWLRGSFLWIRVQNNPAEYTNIRISRKHQDQKLTWSGWVDELAKSALNDLLKHELVDNKVPEVGDTFDLMQIGRSDEPVLQHTQFGKIMSSCCISVGTMKEILKLGPAATLRDCLETLSGAVEFSDLRIRQTETKFLNKLRMSPEIKYLLDDPVKGYYDKVFLLLQGRFGNVQWEHYYEAKTENSSIQQTLMAIYTHAPRIAKAICSVMTTRKYGHGSASALKLLRVIEGKAWEDTAGIFQILKGIGPKSIKVLGDRGIKTWGDIINVEPRMLEAWLNRTQPFGAQLLREARAVDRFEIDVQQVPVRGHRDSEPVVNLDIHITNLKVEAKSKTAVKSWRKMTFISVLVVRSDGKFINYLRLATKNFAKKDMDSLEMVVRLSAADQTISIHVGVDEVSGSATTLVFDPDTAGMDFTGAAEREAREEEERKEKIMQNQPLEKSEIPTPNAASEPSDLAGDEENAPERHDDGARSQKTQAGKKKSEISEKKRRQAEEWSDVDDLIDSSDVHKKTRREGDKKTEPKDSKTRQGATSISADQHIKSNYTKSNLISASKTTTPEDVSDTADDLDMTEAKDDDVDKYLVGDRPASTQAIRPSTAGQGEVWAASDGNSLDAHPVETNQDSAHLGAPDSDEVDPFDAWLEATTIEIEG